MANQADGTTDHKRIQTKCNEAYEGMLVTTQNEIYASESMDNAKKCQMRQNQAYVPTNPERIRSVLPAARVSEDEYYAAIQEQYYEQISITNDDSASTQQLGNKTEENDVAYDYITQ